MQVYLVMRDEETPAADSLFLRDGFSGWAFILAPFWLLRHALWLPALGYVLAAVAISLLEVGSEGIVLLFLVLHAFFGLEGQSMRISDLTKRGYAVKDIVAGDELDEAEIRYFTDMASPKAEPKAPQMPTPPKAPAGLGPWGAHSDGEQL